MLPVELSMIPSHSSSPSSICDLIRITFMGYVKVVAAALQSAARRKISILSSDPPLCSITCGFAYSYSRKVILGLKVSSSDAVYPDQNPVTPFSRMMSW